jgi:hypothetical protein
MKLFKKKKSKELEKKIFDYFNIEYTDSNISATGDFADKDFSDWLRLIHGMIQKALKNKTIDTKKIENYLTISLHIGGQRVEIAIIKDGKKSPEELYKKLLKDVGHNE